MSSTQWSPQPPPRHPPTAAAGHLDSLCVFLWQSLRDKTLWGTPLCHHPEGSKPQWWRNAAWGCSHQGFPPFSEQTSHSRLQRNLCHCHGWAAPPPCVPPPRPQAVRKGEQTARATLIGTPSLAGNQDPS